MGLLVCVSDCFQEDDVPPHENKEQSMTQKKCSCRSHFFTIQGPGFLPLKA